MSPLILIGIVLIIIIALGMVIALVISNDKAKKQRQLAVIKGRTGDTKEKNAVSEQDKRRAEIAKKLKEQDEEDKKPNKKSIGNLLLQAGLPFSVKQFWLFSVFCAVAAVVLCKLMGASGFVTVMMGITGLLGIPRYLLKQKIKKRQKKFLEEFADALEAMVRLLKAGMPVTEAIKMAGREFEGPVGDEMSRIYDAQKIGVPLPEATLAAAERMPVTEMYMFATGIAIQQQTGASLSEVLMNLAGVIRARYRLKRKVQALSSEAKASAGIIGALPFLVGGGLHFINPEYIGILFSTTPGRAMLIGGAVWMCMGIFIMKAMINFKV